MESSEANSSTSFPLSSSPPTSSVSPLTPRLSSLSPSLHPTPPPLMSPVVLSPCAACKILRRRCVDKCVLAPYFPPTEPLKFTIAHRVFGASNIIKLLQELPESQRADAVSSMVYEANARIRDPVYGCAGAICQLQKQVSELQAQLAKAQAELVNMQMQHADLVALICVEMTHSNSNHQLPLLSQSSDAFNGINPHLFANDYSSLVDDTNNACPMWELPLWT
ncbi:LOB domain-containing protein 1 [Acorus calamus]|uniref:LOB domain-containing protein 1 n=1 Tax=Acorus calamus TaxID=4465 RepID=A0AAV9C785_ACOCL|nr:LOB domain-containing protein 1 [Acorus calamus]